ncbi:MAG: hypothetical protein GY861_22210 [bacterium]|nr:hypothetical protein [bacterium]
MLKKENIESLNLQWIGTSSDTVYYPGMIVELSNGEYVIVGDFTARGNQIVLDNGSEEYLTFDGKNVDEQLHDYIDKYNASLEKYKERMIKRIGNTTRGCFPIYDSTTARRAYYSRKYCSSKEQYTSLLERIRTYVPELLVDLKETYESMREAESNRFKFNFVPYTYITKYAWLNPKLNTLNNNEK